MKKLTGWAICLIVAVGINVQAQTKTPAKGPDDRSRDELFSTIQKLDAELFDAYNRCDLEKFGSFFPEQLEFYHDQTGGGPMTREQLVAAIKQNICGKVHRELVKGTLQIYPLKNYGAVELGKHHFTHPGIDCDEGDAKVRAAMEVRRRQVAGDASDQLRPRKREQVRAHACATARRTLHTRLPIHA